MYNGVPKGLFNRVDETESIVQSHEPKQWQAVHHVYKGVPKDLTG